ncbi:hypothetical protein PLIP_a2285 [Pseudoalteromonas lipolytica LMEB 39]|nr:hypothetical protein [Pseudoalteromonas lipolytica LMEB 39]
MLHAVKNHISFSLYAATSTLILTRINTNTLTLLIKKLLRLKHC